MGKQKGEAARSKARPSSSSQAASLLPAGAAAVGFGGYVGGTRLDSTLRGDEPVSFSEVDGEIAQHLKRLARKDPITKLKALSSLSTLLQQRSGKDIIPIIPQWVFEYKRLLMDYNREVRRSTHETMISLVNAVGRDLAPHLKSLMGPWWFSQFDSLSEVSQAAKQSFQVAFPTQDKRLDALMFCTEEIFVYLGDNLKLTPQSMSDLAAAADEISEMHQQVISSSLLALAALLDIVINVQSEGPETDNNVVGPKHVSKARTTAISFAGELFTAHKCFLSFLSSPSPAIRSAAYYVVRSYIKRVPQVFSESDIKNLSSAIYGAFQEKDPSCHAPMWETVVLFSRNFPASWSYINFQKTMLNRFWQFLRNGCYGSLQVSYPALVLFLDFLPVEAIAGEKFFLDFFQNLWSGRNLSHPSNTDRQAFFLAYKECFLWSLHNAPRICDGEAAVHSFQMSLISNILVKVLWNEYLIYIGSKHGDRVLSSGPGDPIRESSKLSDKNLLELKSFDSYLQNLGQCIIEILTVMHQLDHQFLSPFYEAFQNNCLKIFQETDHIDTSSDSLVRVIQFLFLLDQYANQRAEIWPWDSLVGPFLEESFPVISSNDLPAGIKFLTVVLSVFGPRKVVLRLGSHSERFDIGVVSDADKEADLKYFLQVYERMFVSWCLGGNDRSSDVLLDLLLALLVDECFSEQWNIAVSHVTHEGHFEDMSTSDLASLTMLMEKAQKMIIRRRAVSESECWRHKLLDSVAISIMHSTSPFESYDARFIRAILGASSGDDRVLFVSQAAETQIYREALKKLLSFVIDSPYAWVQNFASLIYDSANISPLEVTSSVLVSKMAHFAVEVLDGCYFYNELHFKGCELMPSIIAAVFIIDWECNMTASLSDTVDKSIEAKLTARKEFGKVLHDFRAKMSIPFFRTLDMQSRRKLGSILVQFVRSVIFDGCSGNPDIIASLCCQWIIEVVQCLCCDEIEEQNVLDLLLRSNDVWPLWTRPDSSVCERLTILQPENGVSNVQMNQGYIFVTVIDKLMSRIGIQKVMVGYIAQGPAADERDTNELANPTTFGRVWLASELLCTWKWHGGGAIDTFLPLLSSYAKENNPKSSSFDSMVNVLLDGALLHGEPNKLGFFDSWHPSHDELDAIQEPFLRALICLLLMLFGDGIWERESAHDFFKLLINKLYIGDTANMICLKILPPILHVLARPLQKTGNLSSDLSMDSRPDDFNLLEERLVDDWLPRALKFPCLISWKPGEDGEDWLQLVLSSYPLSVTDNVGVVKVERVVNLSERRLLLELFHKQQYNSMESGVTSELQTAQVLLSRLVVVAVGYCWEEFEDEDWEFVLSQLRCWMEAVILPMEEAIEDLDHAAQSAALDSPKLAVDNTQQPILALDTYHMNAATNALYAYSLILGLVQCPEPAKEDKLLFLKSENCQHTMEQIEEGVLRMFFSNGVAESISRSLCNGELAIMSNIHNAHPFFWKMLASVVVKSSPVAREEAVKSVEHWGLSRYPISSLISILFSSTSATCLRIASFALLSNAPIASQAIIKGNASSHVNETSSGNEVPQNLDNSSEGRIALREEVSCMIESLPADILDIDLEAEERVKVFLSWSLLLSHLVTLPSSSPERERLVQHILDSASSVILDYLFQHIPLDLCVAHSLKKRETELPSELSDLAEAAKLAITTGSLVFAIESLWPIVPQKLAVLAAAIYSLILRLLPAYVRDWFGDLRDRSKSAAIKYFTKAWCSPYLIANELSQIKKLDFEDDNFSVSVSKSANEVVATYTKDETGMDLVIRLPASYPLLAVDAECTRSLGISEVKQRKWLLSMVSFVRNQNGALAEAIRIWKKNFDKAFKGVDDCPICMSVIHTTNHSLPRLACKTCKNKFHSACLYKWFSTSHKSVCPLCQSPF